MILCSGFAAKVYTPEFKGLGTFEGECHHTGHWPREGLDFSGKRVGVIGTGDSGVQIVQEAIKVAAQLTVFQRTPILALPMRQQMLGESEHLEMVECYRDELRKARADGRQYFDILPSEKSAHDLPPQEQQASLAKDWAMGGFHFWGNTFADVLSDAEVNRVAYNFWRDRTRERIRDPAMAKKLAPADPPHPFGTKRPSLAQWYYEAFNQDNVMLVDTLEDSINEITATGVTTEEAEYDLDKLVLASGFAAFTGGLTQFDIVGLNGTMLKDKGANGVQNHLGISVSGFPNMFMLYGPLSPSGLCNGPVCAEIQGEWIVNCMAYLRDNQVQRIEATRQAEEAWVQHVNELADATLFPRADSWYTGANMPGKTRQLLNYPNLPGYMDLCEQCAANGYDGFELS